MVVVQPPVYPAGPALDGLFNPAAHPNVQYLASDVIYYMPYPLQLVADVAIFILPLPVILKLQMPLLRRLQILSVICLGGSAVLVCALRIIVVFQFVAEADNITYVLAKLVIMKCVELQVAIITANMPALKAFWVLWRAGTLRRTKKVSPRPHDGSYQSQLQDFDNDQGLVGIELKAKSGYDRNVSHSQRRLTESRSDEDLCLGAFLKEDPAS